MFAFKFVLRAAQSFTTSHFGLRRLPNTNEILPYMSSLSNLYCEPPILSPLPILAYEGCQTPMRSCHTCLRCQICITSRPVFYHFQLGLRRLPKPMKSCHACLSLSNWHCEPPNLLPLPIWLAKAAQTNGILPYSPLVGKHTHTPSQLKRNRCPPPSNLAPCLFPVARWIPNIRGLGTHNPACKTIARGAK